MAKKAKKTKTDLSAFLQSTKKEYEISDESGYEFVVVAELDPVFGWSATLTVRSGHSFISAEDAVERLSTSTKEFARILNTKKVK